MKNTNASSLLAPDSLNIQFGVLAGSYVAALIAPVLTLFAVEYFDLRSWILALGILGAVGVALGSVVVLLVTDKGKIAGWLNAGWLPWLLPLVGFVPIFAYYFSVIEVFAYLYLGPVAGTTASVVGATGFVLGIAACWLGEFMIRTARNQVASFAVESEDVAIEWTAAWPRPHKIKAQIGVVLPCLAVAGLVAIWYSMQTIVYTLPAVVTFVLVTKSAFADRVYRVTPSGLEHLRKGRMFDSRQFIPWSQIDGFTVTDRSIILYRPSLHPSIRFSRRDFRLNEEEVIDALEEHLNRRNS